MANTANENQLKGAKQLNDLTDAVDFIRKKFEEYEEERQQKDEVIKALKGNVSTLHDHLEKLETTIDRQEQYSRRHCLLIPGVSKSE